MNTTHSNAEPSANTKTIEHQIKTGGREGGRREGGREGGKVGGKVGGRE